MCSENSEHSHSHEHVHADGTVHTHEHSHDHEHSHEHGHCHGHDHDHGHTHPHAHAAGPAGEITPKQELTALMKYMAGHNASHAKELADLAERAKELCGAQVYEQIMGAVAEYEKGNAVLNGALEAMESENE